VLDLGCGDGVVTRQLLAAGCEVVGVDSSPELLESAVGLGLDARLMDGHELSFNHEFDAIFSHAALHWMKRDPSAVLKVRSNKCPRTVLAQTTGPTHCAAWNPQVRVSTALGNKQKMCGTRAGCEAGA